MYSTCIFCHASLGRNQVIEHFPVGRRLAFDAAKGRLWVVCKQCQRWNLTPLEERWEAIEEAERAFRATKLRMSSGEIGLARLREGTELVRIGAPERPEMAAWRYGDQFGARRRKHFVWLAYSVATGGGVLAFGPPAGLASALLVRPVLQRLVPRAQGHLRFDDDAAGHKVVVPEMAWRTARIVASGPDDWRLVVGVRTDGGGDRAWWKYDGVGRTTPLELTGAAALRAAALILPRLNERGAPATQVREAVSLLEQGGGPERLFDDAANRRGPRIPWWKFDPSLPFAGRPATSERRWYTDVVMPGRPLAEIAAPQRLAMEMAVHEESERRALGGELAELEEAWEQAEEIAAIADDLLLPESVTRRLARS